MSESVQKRLAFVINVAFVAVVAAIVYLAFRYAIQWVLPFLLAFCIVSVLNPLIRVIKKNLNIKQEIVSLIVMILIYALVGVLLFLLIMQIFMLIRDALTVLPHHYEQSIQPALIRSGESIFAFLRGLPSEWQEQILSIQDGIIDTVKSFLVNLSQKGVSIVSGITTRIPSFLIAFVFTIMLSFFISMQYDKVVAFFKTQLPPKAQSLIRAMRGIVFDTIVKYFRAALTLMFITFIELCIGLLALRTSNAIPIAAGIAIFDALPFFGTGAIMIPWCIIELLQGNFRFAIGLAILYAIVTVIRNIIEPKVVGDKLGLNPIVSLTAIYIGFKLFGVLGMIFMPILTQIGMELHHIGAIRLYKDHAPTTPPAVSTTEDSE